MTAIMRLIVCVVLLAVAVSTKSVPSVFDIQIVEDIRSYAKSNPNANIIEFVEQKSNIPSKKVRFSLGERVDGDSLVAEETETIFFSTPSDVRKQINYPKSGTGSIITRIEIDTIEHTFSDLGKVYMVDGGFGERKMSFIIEAKDTSYFSYQVQYFGKE